MIISTIKTSDCTPQTIVIGRRTTYDTLQVVFDLSYLTEAYGSGTAVLVVKRSQDETAYPAIITQDGNTLTWTISETDTYYVGAGECELMWYVNNGLAKTIIYPVVVMRDILQTTEAAPDAYENWVESLTALGAETQQHALDAAQSATEAETAQGKAEDAQAAAEDAADRAESAIVHAPIIQDGYWYIWNDGQYVNTNVRAEGEKGDKGDTGEKGDTGNGIASITKTGTSGLVDTYTVTYTDGNTTTFTVTNGAKGDKGDTGATGNGIASIAKTGTSGNVDTYTITYTNGQTTTFTVTNGAVTSVAGKTGAVTLDAGDVAFDDSATYASGTVGAELSNQKNAISEIEGATGLHITTDDFISGTYIGANGTLVTDDRFSRTDMIHIPNGATTIHIIDWKEAGTALAYAFYSGADFTTNNFISGSITTGTHPIDLTIPQNAVYVAFSLRNSYMTFDATISGSLQAYVDEQVAAVQSGIDVKIEAVDDRVTQIPEYVFDGFDLSQKDIPGHDAGVIPLTGLPGYIARSDGQVNGTTGSWIHSDFIAIDDIVGNCGAFYGHGVVADIAYYSSDSFSTYLGYYINASGYDYATASAIKTNAPTGAKYVALSTDSNSKSLYATLSKKYPVTQITVKPDADKEYRLATGHAHISFDDCLFWIDLINNESTYTSAFQNSFLADVKEIHDEYGATFTLTTFNTNKTANTSATHDISNVPSKFAAELGACSSWLKFAFHGEDITVLYNTDDAAGILASYNKFKAAIFQMTGTVDSIDRVTRLSSFTGTLANVKAIRDTTAGISGLLATDQTSGGNYYFASGSDANNMILNKGQYYDAENQIHFIKSQMRIEHGSFSTDVYNTLDYANYWPMFEFFAHEPQWSDNVKSKTKNLCAWLLNHGFDFTFAEHVYGI